MKLGEVNYGDKYSDIIIKKLLIDYAVVKTLKVNTTFLESLYQFLYYPNYSNQRMTHQKIFEKRNIDVLQNKCWATASGDIIEQMLLRSDIQTLLYGRKTLGKLKYTWILNNASSSSLSPREFSENLFKDGCYISLAWGYKFCFTYFCFTLLKSA